MNEMTGAEFEERNRDRSTEIPSAEFRKTYAKLRKPTTVTVNGHVIGQWIPAHSATYVMARRMDDEGQEQHTAHGLLPPRDAVTEFGTSKTAQAKRDDLLRKINRGK